MFNYVSLVVASINCQGYMIIKFTKIQITAIKFLIKSFKGQHLK